MKKNREIEVSKIQLQYVNQPQRRRIKVHLSNGTNVYIVRCYESYEQYGGTIDELRITLPIAEKYNSWLHGEQKE